MNICFYILPFIGGIIGSLIGGRINKNNQRKKAK